LKLPELTAERQGDNKRRIELRKVETAFLVVIAGRKQYMILNKKSFTESVRKRLRDGKFRDHGSMSVVFRS
jgi:hypothetical protein